MQGIDLFHSNNEIGSSDIRKRLQIIDDSLESNIRYNVNGLRINQQLFVNKIYEIEPMNLLVLV